MALWMEEPFRATRDIDVLSYGDNDWEDRHSKFIEATCDEGLAELTAIKGAIREKLESQLNDRVIVETAVNDLECLLSLGNC